MITKNKMAAENSNTMGKMPCLMPILLVTLKNGILLTMNMPSAKVINGKSIVTISVPNLICIKWLRMTSCATVPPESVVGNPVKK